MARATTILNSYAGGRNFCYKRLEEMKPIFLKSQYRIWLLVPFSGCHDFFPVSCLARCSIMPGGRNFRYTHLGNSGLGFLRSQRCI